MTGWDWLDFSGTRWIGKGRGIFTILTSMIISYEYARDSRVHHLELGKPTIIEQEEQGGGQTGQPRRMLRSEQSVKPILETSELETGTSIFARPGLEKQRKGRKMEKGAVEERQEVSVACSFAFAAATQNTSPPPPCVTGTNVENFESEMKLHTAKPVLGDSG